MRMKKFREILALLPESDELRKVRSVLDTKAERVADIMAKIRKIAKYIAWIYFTLYWAVQTILDFGIF